MGKINVRHFKNEPLETLELEGGKTWYLNRPTEESRHKVQAATEAHTARVTAFGTVQAEQAKARAAKMQDARAAAEKKGDADPDVAAREWLEAEPVNEDVTLDVTPRYQAAAIVACHLKPAGLDPGTVLDELGESLVYILFERVIQETTGEAAKKALAGPGLYGI